MTGQGTEHSLKKKRKTENKTPRRNHLLHRGIRPENVRKQEAGYESVPLVGALAGRFVGFYDFTVRSGGILTARAGANGRGKMRLNPFLGDEPNL